LKVIFKQPQEPAGTKINSAEANGKQRSNSF